MNERLTEEEYLEIKRETKKDIKVFKLASKSSKERIEIVKKIVNKLPSINKEYKKVYELNLLFPNNKDFEDKYKKLKETKKYPQTLLQMKKLEIKTYGKYVKEEENMEDIKLIDLDEDYQIDVELIGTVNPDKSITYEEGKHTSRSAEQILEAQNEALFKSEEEEAKAKADREAELKEKKERHEKDLEALAAVKATEEPKKELLFSKEDVTKEVENSVQIINSIIDASNKLSAALKESEEKNKKLTDEAAMLKAKIKEMQAKYEYETKKALAYEEAFKQINGSLVKANKQKAI